MILGTSIAYPININTKMNLPFNINNILVYNALWYGFWAVELWTGMLKLHVFTFGIERTPLYAEGWRLGATLVLGLSLLCIWALKLPVEAKQGFLRYLTATYVAELYQMIVDRHLYSSASWVMYLFTIGLGAILTYLGGFVLSQEETRPLKKTAIPEPVVEPTRDI